MPLNVPKTDAFIPNPVGRTILSTRSATRARLSNESFYRSVERGRSANQIQCLIVEDTVLPVNEAVFVVHHTALKPDESVFISGMAMPVILLLSLNLTWNEEIRITLENGTLGAKLYGIRWQIAGGPAEILFADLGPVLKDKIFSANGTSFKLSALPADWSVNAVLSIRPRTRRYPLATHSVSDPDTMQSITGWDPNALRGALNGLDPWIKMPARGIGATAPTTGAEDRQDEGVDAAFLVPFGPVNLQGGDGLPTTPTGINTGPSRALVHLNYSEREDGSMGEFNQVFEWIGDSGTVGSWQRYA